MHWLFARARRFPEISSLKMQRIWKWLLVSELSHGSGESAYPGSDGSIGLKEKISDGKRALEPNRDDLLLDKHFTVTNLHVEQLLGVTAKEGYLNGVQNESNQLLTDGGTRSTMKWPVRISRWHPNTFGTSDSALHCVSSPETSSRTSSLRSSLLGASVQSHRLDCADLHWPWKSPKWFI